MLRGIALCAALLALAGCGGSEITSAPTGTPASSEVAHETRLGGLVQVVAYPHGDVRICESGFSDLMLRLGPPRPPDCRDGLRAIGMNVSGLTNDGTKSRERWGTRYLVGVYRDGVFRVLSQRRDAPPTREPVFLAKTPCPAPAGGWRPVASDLDMEKAIAAYRHQHRGEVTSLARFHDGVLVLTSTRPARTRALLGRQWPGAICVVRARYSHAVIRRVQNRMLKLLFGEWHGKSDPAKYGWITGAGGTGESERGQPTTGIELLIVTPQLRAILRRQPPGLVEVDATLKPVRAGDVATRSVPHPVDYRHAQVAEIRAARASNAETFGIFPARPGTTPCVIPSLAPESLVGSRPFLGRCRTSVAYPVTHGRFAEAFVTLRESWGARHWSAWTLIVQWPSDKVVATQRSGQTAPQTRYVAR
ncbi:MAG TPA: hypothetical protein VGH79_07260 [Gaiellaceae bacterium]|jgi:hypothetical protein